MLVTLDEAMAIVSECKMVATKAVNGYNGKKLCDLQTYAGKYGSGYTVTKEKTRQYWCYPVNTISDAVYNGQYSIADACMTANNVHHINYAGTKIVPSWKMELDTVSGENTLKTTDESVKPMTLSGRKLTIMWRGSIQNNLLRHKIRRKLKALLRSGNAKLIKDNFFGQDAQLSKQKVN